MKDSKPEELEDQVRKLVKNDSLEEITRAYAEIGLDSLVDDDIIKDLPLIGTSLAILRFGKNIADYFFAKKLLAFLSEISKADSNQRKKFIEEIERKEKLEEKIGETLIFMISGADSVSKSKLFGKLYKNCISGVIDYNQLERLCNLVDRAYLGDLEGLYTYHKNGQISSIAKESLINIGAISISGFGGQTTHGQTQGLPLYQISEIGDLFVRAIYREEGK